MEVLLQRCQGRWIPAHVECCAQRVVARRTRPGCFDTALPSGPSKGDTCPALFSDRMERRPVSGKQRLGQTRADKDADEKRDGQQSENRAGDFQKAARSPPSAALLVVKYRLARFHTFISNERSVAG